jgi:hypothetical protein
MGPPRGGMARILGIPSIEGCHARGRTVHRNRPRRRACGAARVVRARPEAPDDLVAKIVRDGGQGLAVLTDVAGCRLCVPSHPPDGPSPRAFEFGEEV